MLAEMKHDSRCYKNESGKLVILGPIFYCYLDENNFFNWLESIVSKDAFRGGSEGLVVTLPESGLNQEEWADLIGLMTRYNIDIQGLADFVTSKNENWLKDQTKYWYAAIFRQDISEQKKI